MSGGGKGKRERESRRRAGRAGCEWGRGLVADGLGDGWELRELLLLSGLRGWAGGGGAARQMAGSVLGGREGERGGRGGRGVHH